MLQRVIADFLIFRVKSPFSTFQDIYMYLNVFMVHIPQISKVSRFILAHLFINKKVFIKNFFIIIY